MIPLPGKAVSVPVIIIILGSPHAVGGHVPGFWLGLHLNVLLRVRHAVLKCLGGASALHDFHLYRFICSRDQNKRCVLCLIGSSGFDVSVSDKVLLRGFGRPLHYSIGNLR